jgi:protein arginine kinase
MNKWYSSQGNNSDVVVSSKIRLARNLEKTPFPCRMSDDVRKSVCKKIYASIQNSEFAGEFDLIEMNKLTDLKKISLAEKALTSPEFAKQSNYGALLLSKDESVSIMLCEEDHIRLCVMSAGQALEEAYKRADRLDDVLIKALSIAFSQKLGFLTSNPMNLGTGLKASLILHLPAIKEKRMIPTLTNMISKLGFSLKPLYSNQGAFYELSNQISLGITEKSAIANLNSITNQIVKQERALRDELVSYDEFEDKIYRALGTLKMARKLSVKEWYNLASLVRLGISTGSFDEKYENIGEMMYSLGTATILSDAQEEFSVEDADRLRATYVRQRLS